MSKITLDKERLVVFLEAILKDDYGISEDAYNKLYDLIAPDSCPSDNIVLRNRITIRVEAVDGRFFIPNV